MKNPEEYLEKWSFYNEIPTRELEVILKQMQIDAWNEALDKAAENADADVYFRGWLAEQEPFVEGEDYEVYVLNQSILKLKL